MLFKNIKLVIVASLCLSSLGLLGCQNFGKETSKRSFTFEPIWVRSTTKEPDLGYRRQNRMRPELSKKLVFVGNAIDNISAYDRFNGDEIWRFDVKSGVEGGASLVGDKLYFGASNGQFYALQAGTGRLIGSFPLRAESLSPPNVQDGRIYHLSGDGRLYAIEAKSGSKLWVYSKRSSSNLSIRASSRPLIFNNRVYVGFADGSISCLNAQTGGLIWEKNLGRGEKFNDVDSSPVIHKGKLFVSSFERGLFALDPNSGATLWTHEDGSSHSVLPVQNKLFYPTEDGRMIALDASSGKKLWDYKLSDGIATQAVHYKGLIIFGSSDGPITALNAASGRFVKKFETGFGVKAVPRINEKTGELFVLTTGANVFAFKLAFKRDSDQLPWDMTE